MLFGEVAEGLWAFPHIDDVATLFGICMELDEDCQVMTMTYHGRRASFSTEGWYGLTSTSEPHVYFDFLMQCDVSSYDDFEEWAASHDHRTDERRNHVLWRYYRLLSSRLQRLFGEDFDYIMHACIDEVRDEENDVFSPQLVERFAAVVRAKVESPACLVPQDVVPLMREVQALGWGTAFMHWLLSCEALGEQTRNVLVGREEEQENP